MEKKQKKVSNHQVRQVLRVATSSPKFGASLQVMGVPSMSSSKSSVDDVPQHPGWLESRKPSNVKKFSCLNDVLPGLVN